MYAHDNRPGIPMVLVASAARTTSSNSGNLKDATAWWPNSPNMAVYFNLTTYTVDAREVTGAVRFSIETSVDGGTTWLTAWKASDITTSTAIRVATIRNGYAVDTNDAEEQRTNRAVNTTSGRVVSTFPMSRDVRIAWDIGDGTTDGNGIEATFAVYAVAQP